MTDKKSTTLIRGRAVAEDTDQLFAISTGLANSSLCPKQYKNNPRDAFAAVIAGAEVGLQPMQSLKSIAVINGRASIYGDGLPAIAYASGKLKKFTERFDSDQQGNPVAVVIIERSDVEGEREFRFGQSDAVKAGLWGKSGPWSQYPTRMLQMRARSYAFRDCFADYLAGLHVAEEQQDIRPIPVQVDEESFKFSELDDPADDEVIDVESVPAEQPPDVSPELQVWISLIQNQETAEELEQLVAAEIQRDCDEVQIALLEGHIESKRKEFDQ